MFYHIQWKRFVVRMEAISKILFNPGFKKNPVKIGVLGIEVRVVLVLSKCSVFLVN